MNKSFFIILLLMAVSSAYGVLGTTNQSVVSNYFIMMRASALPQTNYSITNIGTLTNFTINTNMSSLTVGPIYGLSGMGFLSNTNFTIPNSQIKIPFSITNFANDADSNALLMVQFMSNNTGYAGSPWTYNLEVAGTNQSNLYAIPFTSFGEGAVLNFNLVVNIPANCPIKSIGTYRVIAMTTNTPSHVAAIYSGFNGTNYGGNEASTNITEIDIFIANSIVSLKASDGIDTITSFDGTLGLRKSKNTITVTILRDPLTPSNVNIWYSTNSFVSTNSVDFTNNMRFISPKVFQADIPENELSGCDYVSFLFQIDGFFYGTNSVTNYIYNLLDLTKQGNYQTILMHNIISLNSDDSIYIKLPEKILGKSGKVYLYSISGDLVKVIQEGTLGDQIIPWNGLDKTGAKVSKGMYFIVVDYDGVKEVRKVYIK